MSGSKATDDDQRRHPSSSSGSGQHHVSSSSDRRLLPKQPLLNEIPFSSPASPIPKNNDDHDDDDEDDELAYPYPSEIPGSSNEDSEPYILSSMSEEDQQQQQRIPQDAGFDKSPTPLHMEFDLKPSTSSEENKFTPNNNGSGREHQQHQQVVPVNFKKKELRCVTDVPLLPTVGTGSFSPLGSVASTHGSIDTPTGYKQMPKFYDSEEEGVGSLVLVPSTKSLSSPRVSGGGSGGPTPPQFPLPKDRHGLTTTPAHLLPYQQRKKLVEQQPPDKRPPPVPPSKQPSFGGGGVVVVGSSSAAAAAEPLPNVSGAELAKKYGGVAEIPPFRGGGQSGPSDGDNNGPITPMKKSKSADSSNKPIPNNTISSSPPINSNNNNEGGKQRMDDSWKQTTTTRPTPPPPEPILQEVICPPPPPESQHSPLPSSSPSGESYHIRVSSCGSISSLGSMAVDSDSIRHASRRDSHPNNGLQHQQHQQQQQQQYYPQMQPPPPNHYYGGYMSSQTPNHPQQPPPPHPMHGGPPNNFLDLSQDIAMFLHGEQIANGEAAAQIPSHHHHHGEYPPPNYWNHNPSYGWGGGGGVGGGGGGNPYHQQQQQHYPPPPQPQAEPIPPPLTQVPNMQMGHRSRLPSISDDDWSEDIDKYKTDMDGREEGNKQTTTPTTTYPLPPPQRSSYNYGRDRMAYPHQLPPRRRSDQQQHQQQRTRKENHHHHHQQQQQHPENGPDERSSLLGPPGNRNYEEYSGWNGGGAVGNPNTNLYYNTPPRRGGGGNTNKKNPQESKSTNKRKKSKRRRRTEKEKLRNMYSTDSSPEDEEKHRRSVRSSRRKKRHVVGRKRRDDDVSDTISETYSESFMSASLADRLKSAEANVNFFQRMIIRTKLLICNLPLSAAAISFSIVLLGIVWLRRAEEILTSCKEVNFHSSQCNFPEFPGCYFCDTFDRWYQVATNFHTVCSYVGGVSVALYAAKAVLFGRVFIDEMSSPTAASPAGLIFMTMALAFTGKGAAGAVLVFVASFLHLALLLWFIYMSLAYQTMPDPSWFPNTIGIGLCAVKVWFYNPLCGHFLIAMTLMLTFLYYPISLIRVALNEKMSATICWMQMICPAISLYSLAIVMQPSFKEERPDISHFQTMQRTVYLPSMTCLFGLCIVGMISSLQGLAVRWKQIQKEEFTPAHAAYSFPLLMHALAVQAYRSSLGFFSETGEVNPALKSVLEIYWIVLVTVGTFVAVVCLIMYLSFLPSWIDVNTSEELEPPAPNETSMFETVTWGESLIQPYVSPTILQSNEAGVLVMTHDYENNWGTLVRTKKVPAVGFEPMMRTRTFHREREALKHLVGGQDVIHEGDEADDDFCFESQSTSRA